MMTPELIDRVLAALAGGRARQSRIDQCMRADFPGVMFSVCDDNDVPSRIRPLASGEGFALYGIGTGGHCATLVSDIEAASGFAIALTGED